MSSVISVFLAFFVVTLAVDAGAADDDYLRMLEGEAEELSLDSSGQVRKHAPITKAEAEIQLKDNWEWEGEIDPEQLPPGLAQDEFATYLKQYFYGTFVFYSKLTPADRDKIYAGYDRLRKPMLEEVRQNILNQLRLYR